MKTRKLFPLFAFLMMLNILQFVNASPALDMTLTTDKWIYDLGGTVKVQGNLTWNGSPVPDGLVALQIDDPKDGHFIIQTLPTGTPPAEGWTLEILEVIPCDSQGRPKQSFTRGEKAYFNITLRNNDKVSRYTLVGVNIFDANMVPLFASVPFEASIAPGLSPCILFSYVIPEEAALGSATIYASAFNKLPKDLGYPYCPQKSAVFTIESPVKAPPSTSYPVGTYGLTFKLPWTGKLGVYDIYATSYYKGEWVYASIMFKVTLLGDINQDGTVNILDAISLAKAFGTKPGDPRWDPRCDINKDNVVNILDALLVAGNFGKSGTS